MCIFDIIEWDWSPEVDIDVGGVDIDDYREVDNYIIIGDAVDIIVNDDYIIINGDVIDR